jgi:hypothetical protein
MILVKHCRDGAGGSNLRISRDRLRFPAQGSWSLSRVSSSDVPLSLGEERVFFTVMKMAGGLCSLLSGIEVDRGSSTGHKVPLSTASVTADSVGPAAPGIVQRCNKNCSSSTLCLGQAHSRASQGGSCNWEWGQKLWSSTARMELAGSSLKTSRDRLRLLAQGGWSLSRVSSSGVAALSG